MTTVLLTLGRMPKALALARSLHGAGCRVIVAEPFRWHSCRLSRAVARSYPVAAPNTDLARYQDELLEIIERERVDLIVPISEEVMHALSITPRLPPGVRFFSPPAAELMALHDKLSFARTAASYGLDVPETYALDTPQAAGLAQNTSVVVKPTHSCSGIGMEILPAGTTLPTPARHGRHIAQRFIDGQHVSTFSIAHEGQLRATVIYRGRIFTRTVAVCFERVPQLPVVTKWVESFVRQAGYSGYISFDFIIEDDRALAIECNPRLTSGVHFLEPSSLAAATLAPADAPPAKFRDRPLQQQFYTALTKTGASLLRPKRLLSYTRDLLQARDVTWSWRDPLPFLLMIPACYEILAQTMFAGRSFGEAVTRDIAWFADEEANELPPPDGDEESWSVRRSST